MVGYITEQFIYDLNDINSTLARVHNIAMYLKASGIDIHKSQILAAAKAYVLDKPLSLMDILTSWEHKVAKGIIPEELKVKWYPTNITVENVWNDVKTCYLNACKITRHLRLHPDLHETLKTQYDAELIYWMDRHNDGLKFMKSRTTDFEMYECKAELDAITKKFAEE